MLSSRILSLLLCFSLCLCFSCSPSAQDDPVVPNPDAPTTSIAFSSNNSKWQDEQTTRGAGNGLETLFTSFRVWGYKTTSDVSALSSSQIVMDGYKVLFTQGSAGNTASNTADWEYVGIENPMLSIPQTIKYWDHSATSYRFFAYSPFRSDVTVTAPSTADPNVSLSFPFEYSDAATATSSPYTSRLWLATPSSNGTSATSPAYGSCVTLTFAPIIAKVRFRFTCPNCTKSCTMRSVGMATPVASLMPLIIPGVKRPMSTPAPPAPAITPPLTSLLRTAFASAASTAGAAAAAPAETAVLSRVRRSILRS